MGGWLKADTAATVKIGPFVDDTDFKTAETGLTIQKADVRLSKNGGNLAAASADQGASDAGAAHDELGYYDIALGTGDTDTEGTLRVIIKESGALVVWDDFMVLAAAVYDSLVAGTDKLAVDAQEISSDSDAANNAELFFDGTGYAGGTIKLSVSAGAMEAGALADFINVDSGVTSAAAVEGSVAKELADLLAIPTAATIADAVWDEASTGHTDAGKAGAQLWTDIDAILVDTGTDGVQVAGMKQAALADFFDTDSGTTFAAAVAGSVVKETASSASVTGDVTVGSASIASIADAVWDEVATGHTSAGKAGEQLWTDVDAILTDTGTDGVLVAGMKQAALADFFDTDSTKDYTDAIAGSVVNEIAEMVWAESSRTITGTVTVAGFNAGAITAAAFATDAITADALASSAVTEIANAVSDPEVGAGSETVTIGVSVGATPIDGCAVWITSDIAGATVVAGTVYTSATGHVTVYLDPGTYYVWKQHAGYNFTNPEAITVTDE